MCGTNFQPEPKPEPPAAYHRHPLQRGIHCLAGPNENRSHHHPPASSSISILVVLPRKVPGVLACSCSAFVSVVFGICTAQKNLPGHVFRAVSEKCISPGNVFRAVSGKCISLLQCVTTELVSRRLEGNIGTDTACCAFDGWKHQCNAKNTHIWHTPRPPFPRTKTKIEATVSKRRISLLRGPRRHKTRCSKPHGSGWARSEGSPQKQGSIQCRDGGGCHDHAQGPWVLLNEGRLPRREMRDVRVDHRRTGTNQYLGDDL